MPDIPTAVPESAGAARVQAVNLDPLNAESWLSLGDALVLPEFAADFGSEKEVYVNGATMDARGCYLRGLALDPRSSDAWNGLGCTVGKEESVVVSDRSYSRRDCFVMALHLDRTCGLAWYNLGNLLDVEDLVMIQPPADVSVDDSIVREGPPPVHAAAASTSSSSPASPSTRKYTTQMCYEEALQYYPKHERSWYNLALVLPSGSCATVFVAATTSDDGGDDASREKQHLSVADCLVRCVESDPCFTRGWRELKRYYSDTTTVMSVAGQSVSHADCLATVMFLAGDAEGAEGWLELCDAIVAAPNGKAIVASKTAATRRLGPSDSSGDLPPLVKVEFTARQCAEHAIRCCPRDASAWNAMGNELFASRGNATAAVFMFREDNSLAVEETYSSLQCYARAVTCNPALPAAWYNVGNTLSVDACITIHGEPCSARNCYEKAVAMDPTMSRAWYNLGWLLAAQRRRRAEGAPVSLAISSDGASPAGGVDDLLSGTSAEGRLSSPNPPPSTPPVVVGTDDLVVIVNGQAVTHAQCLANCLDHLPTYRQAWSALGELLLEVESSPEGRAPVLVHGRPQTAASCFAAFLELDPRDARGWRQLAAALATTPCESGSVSVSGEIVTPQLCQEKVTAIEIAAQS